MSWRKRVTVPNLVLSLWDPNIMYEIIDFIKIGSGNDTSVAAFLSHASGSRAAPIDLNHPLPDPTAYQASIQT